MTQARRLVLGSAVLCLGLAGNIGLIAQHTPAPPPAPPTTQETPRPVRSTVAPKTTAAPQTAAASTPAPGDHNAVIRRYCVTCHNDTRKTGGLSLSL